MRNPASIGVFTGDFRDPPTQSEMRAFRDWPTATSATGLNPVFIRGRNADVAAAGTEA